MPGGVGVLSPEGGAKGVDIPEGHGEGLAVELAGHRQVGGLAEEVLGEIHLAVLGAGHVVQIQGGYLEHLACAFAVRAGNQRGVNVNEVPVLEELVDGHGRQAADTEHRLEGIGPGPQVGNGAQELHGVALGLQGIVAGGRAFHLDLGGLKLESLLGVRRQDQSALDNQGSANVDFGDFLEILQSVVINHLNGGEISTIIQDNKAKLLAGPPVSHPAADFNFLARIGVGIFEQLTNGNQFH